MRSFLLFFSEVVFEGIAPEEIRPFLKIFSGIWLFFNFLLQSFKRYPKIQFSRYSWWQFISFLEILLIRLKNNFSFNIIHKFEFLIFNAIADDIVDDLDFRIVSLQGVQNRDQFPRSIQGQGVVFDVDIQEVLELVGAVVVDVELENLWGEVVFMRGGVELSQEISDCF